MENKIQAIKKNLMKPKDAHYVSQLFKVISDPTRIMILFALKGENLSVSELVDILDMTQSAVSHQLKTLRDANLVVNKRMGKEVYYRLADDHVHTIFNQALAHVGEWSLYE